jgi:Zn-dependent M28 family amino/carboxypeptidase
VGERLREGSVRAKERQDLIERLFREVGCDVTLQPIDKKSANVICDLPGETSDTLIVGAHFDFADEGQGIVDDWSGTSMLVSLYQALKANVSKHSYEFVAFAGEERGLLGSTQYVKQLSARSNIVPQAFVNLECLGLTPPKVWVTRSTSILVQPLIEIANAMRIPLQGVNVDNIGDDDTRPFLSKKLPVISIHSVTQEKWQILHSQRDNLSAINPTDYYDAYRLVAFYLNYLDARLSQQMMPAAHH